MGFVGPLAPVKGFPMVSIKSQYLQKEEDGRQHPTGMECTNHTLVQHSVRPTARDSAESSVEIPLSHHTN